MPNCAGVLKACVGDETGAQGHRGEPHRVAVDDGNKSGERGVEEGRWGGEEGDVAVDGGNKQGGHSLQFSPALPEAKVSVIQRMGFGDTDDNTDDSQY